MCLLRFVEKYSELESRGDVKPEILLEETAKALLADGVVLRKRGGGPVVSLCYELEFYMLHTADGLVVYYNIICIIHKLLCITVFGSVLQCKGRK